MAEFQKKFLIDIEFGASENVLVFDRRYLECVPPHANPLTALMCEQHCRNQMESLQVKSGAATLISHYLLSMRDRPPSLQTMSRLLNVSERTLKRKLHEEDTSFSDLLANSRQAIAKELMSNGQMTITDIAE